MTIQVIWSSTNYWWLCSPGSSDNHATYVCGDNGNVYDYPKKAVKTTKNNSITIKKIGGEKIDFSKNMKMYVAAYDNAGNKVGKTVSAHVAGKDSKKYKNPKSVKLTTKTLTLTTGQTSKVKATVKMEKGRIPPVVNRRGWTGI